jgi:hypothetical protein
MSSVRDDIARETSSMLDGRPVRWTPGNRLVGDYDGRERTLEIFNTEAAEQRPLLRILSRRNTDELDARVWVRCGCA